MEGVEHGSVVTNVPIETPEAPKVTGNSGFATGAGLNPGSLDGRALVATPFTLALAPSQSRFMNLQLET